MDNQRLNTDFKTLVESYQYGFIYSWEFIFQYMDHLNALGAGKDLMDTLDKELRPLATFLVRVINGSGNLIQDYNLQKDII